jgi:hypothetical protein
MASAKTFYIIACKPQAPVFLDIAFLAIDLRALSVKYSFT